MKSRLNGPKMSNSSSVCSSRDIAVIGMAGQFPGARNLNEFWENLQSGVESISFFSRADVIATGLVDPRLASDPDYVRAAGILEDIDLFDAGFFGYSPREAESIDPQQRVFLQCCWHALEDAGCDPSLLDNQVGVYAGCGMSTYYFQLYRNPSFIAQTGHFQLLVGNDKDYLSTRISYKLNLKGPSFTVQTACSTSLVAVGLACESLLYGQCDVAIAGGVSIRVPQKTGYYYHPGGIYSPDGHCRPFDARANGTVFGHGAGVVVLKRIGDAVEAGDRIRAIIRSAAVNNDGNLKVGYTAPSAQGQAEVIALAHSLAEIDPATVTYVETHGTATPLGDPIEIEALTQAFRMGTSERAYCAVGSVKSNIGHLDSAAGIAGLIKTILALEHRAIPPSINCEEPSPRICFEKSPFFVNTRLSEWNCGSSPRRAGVSSFGVGGTNAHVILEEARNVDKHPCQESSSILTLSAMSMPALEIVTLNCAEFLAGNPSIQLADAARTYQSRKALPIRRIIVCDTKDKAITLLRNAKNISTAANKEKQKSVIFVFPGQGSQYVGMGADLYATEPRFRSRIDEYSAFLKPILGRDLRSLIYPSPKSEKAAADLLNQTEFTQPALLAVEYALAQLLKDWGIQPDAMIGHSIGEYTAACLAGVFSIEDALRAVASRGRLMRQTSHGAMLSVPLSENDVQKFMFGPLCVACLNEDNQTVISGPEEAIRKLEFRLIKEGISSVRLKSSRAFHSSQMDPILKPYLKVLHKIKLNAPAIRFVSNVSGTWISDSSAQSPDYWPAQLRGTVRFAECIRSIHRDFPDAVWVEVGPGDTLTNIVKRHNAIPNAMLTTSLPPHHLRPGAEFISKAVASLWLHGIPVDFSKLPGHRNTTIISAPLYPFARERYWIEAAGAPTPLIQPSVTNEKNRDIRTWFYVPHWKQSSVAKQDIPSPNTKWLIFEDEVGVSSQFRKELAKRGHLKVVRVTPASEFEEAANGDVYRIDPEQNKHYEELFRKLSERRLMPDRIVHAWSISAFSAAEIESYQRVLHRGFYSLLRIAQAVGELGHSDLLRILVCTRNTVNLNRADNVSPERAMILGACTVIPQEYSNARCSLVDVSLSEHVTETPEKIADLLLKESNCGESDQVVAYRRGRRWVREFESVDLKEIPRRPGLLRKGGVYLITGGMGGIGLVLAGYLADRVKAKLVLVGRSELPPRRSWDTWLVAHEETDRTSRIILAIRDLERRGAEVLAIQADVSNGDQMRAAIETAQKRFQPINGIIHAAGVAGGTIVQLQSQETAEYVFAPKVHGIRVLESLLRNSDLDFVVLCSSMTALLGGAGQVSYCAANAYLDAFAYANSRRRPRYISINWNTWQQVGMAVNTPVPDNLKRVREMQLENGITSDEGVDAFERILRAELCNVAVSTTDFRPLLKANEVNRHEEDPLTHSNGLHVRPQLERPYVGPRNPTEQALVTIWRDVLGLSEVGVNDNFFTDLNGHSLLATQVVSRIHKMFSVEFSVRQFFDCPTISDSAKVIEMELAAGVAKAVEEEGSASRDKSARAAAI